MTLDTLIEILEKIKASSSASHVIVHVPGIESGRYYKNITSVSTDVNTVYVIINTE